MARAWDADGHVYESEATFSDAYWDPKFRDQRPIVIEPSPGSYSWLIESRLFPRRAGTFLQSGGTPASKDGVPSSTQRDKVNDPMETAEFRSAADRLAQLDREDIAVQINYPTMLLSWPLAYDPGLGDAIARSYNSWMADVSARAPDRLKWVTVIDPGDPKLAAKEIYRTKEMGSVGLMLLGTAGDVHLDAPSLEPIWNAAAETKLPVAIHVGFCSPALGDLYDIQADTTVMPFMMTLLMGFQRVMSKGILDRYPDLRVAFLEAGCQWVPFLVDRVAEYSSRPGYLSKLQPEEYIQRGQVYFGAEVDDGLLPYVVDKFGGDCWLYASDIPHGDRYLGSVDLLLGRMDITEETKQKILVENPARFYGLPLNGAG